MLVGYLNNPSEEAIFESNRINELHETIKIQNEEVNDTLFGISVFSWQAMGALEVSTHLAAARAEAKRW